MRIEQLQELISNLAGSRVRSRRPPKMTFRFKRHLAALGKTGDAFHPDERDVLGRLCELIDAETVADEAWNLVNDISKILDISRPSESDEQQKAITLNLRAFTLAYQDLKKEEIASGVLVDIGGRTFVATTAHSIPPEPSNRLVMIGENATNVYQAKPSILSFGTTDENTLDVGFLELDTRFVKESLGKSALPLSRIFPCGPGQPNHATFVCGYPSAHVQTTIPAASVKLQKFTFQSWWNASLKPPDWNQLPSTRRPPNDSIDLFIPYPRQDNILCNGVELTEDLNQPNGLSGGGYWQPNVSLKQNIWTPDYYCLIGIQSAWCGRYLRGTQIIHWLRLVWKLNGDLRQHLDAAFPSVDFAAEL